jgi:hypothetical protein
MENWLKIWREVTRRFCQGFKERSLSLSREKGIKEICVPSREKSGKGKHEEKGRKLGGSGLLGEGTSALSI